MTTRRALPLAAVATTLLAAGCGYGTPAHIAAGQEQARVAFLKGAAKRFDDRELARLCPGLYPRDFLTNTTKYPDAKAAKGHKAQTPTAAERAQARAAGCAVRP